MLQLYCSIIVRQHLHITIRLNLLLRLFLVQLFHLPLLDHLHRQKRLLTSLLMLIHIRIDRRNIQMCTSRGQPVLYLKHLYLQRLLQVRQRHLWLVSLLVITCKIVVCHACQLVQLHVSWLDLQLIQYYVLCLL